MPAIDLSEIEAFGDLPDEARDAFARAATVRDLLGQEEAAGFALGLVLEGSVDVAALRIDAPVLRLEAGAVLRTRGSIDRVLPIRFVGASARARIATWDERAVAEAFRTCPWVEDDLRSAGDRAQALAGVATGVLGSRLDTRLRNDIANKLTLRALSDNEIFATRGQPVPGLLLVGAGELEIIGDDGRANGTVIRTGEFLFPGEILRPGPAPHTVRAARGGALLLTAERGVAHELIVTYPPLLEVVAGL